jgi:hypothetical protein
MELIKQNGNTCLITASAMLLGVRPSVIISCLGHDGQELNEEGKMTGVHPQEIIDFAFNYLVKKLLYIERHPYIQNGDIPNAVYQFSKSRFFNYLVQCEGVLITQSHAVAWDKKMVYDPKGQKYKLNNIIEEVIIGLFI